MLLKIVFYKKFDIIFISELCYVLAGGFMVWCGVLQIGCGGPLYAKKNRAFLAPVRPWRHTPAWSLL